jgi:addiction module HigA family antidote
VIATSYQKAENSDTNEFVRGKRGVTADAALDLGEALGTSARLWMNLQSTWDLSQAERRRSAA